MRGQGRSNRLALVGEAPSQGSGTRPFDGASGRRVARLLGVDDVRRAFSVYNVLPSWPGPAAKGCAFPLRAARPAAEALLPELRRYRGVVVAGRRAAAAFGLRGTPYLEWVDGPTGRPWAVLPHPSGVNHWWNDADEEERARRFLERSSLGEVGVLCISCYATAPTPSQEEHPMAKAPAATAPPAGKQSLELYEQLLAHLRDAKIGDVTPHPKGIYARLMDGKRTFGYVVPRKTTLLVYPNILAASMPKGVTFEQVEIDKHHYGRGEAILTVSGKRDFAGVTKALKAAHANPIPKKARVKAETAETPETPDAPPVEPEQPAPADAPPVEQREVEPDPKPGAKGDPPPTEEVAAA